MRYRSFLNSISGDDASNDFTSFRSSEPGRRELFVGSLIKSFQAQNHETGEESKTESVTLTVLTKSIEYPASSNLQLLDDSEPQSCDTPAGRREQSPRLALSQDSECEGASAKSSIRDPSRKRFKRKSRAGKLGRVAEWFAKQVCCGSQGRPATAGRESSSHHGLL